jgi:hypothetical protein
MPCMQIFDKLLCSVGQDIMDALYRTIRDHPRYLSSSLVLHILMAVVYVDIRPQTPLIIACCCSTVLLLLQQLCSLLNSPRQSSCLCLCLYLLLSRVNCFTFDAVLVCTHLQSLHSAAKASSHTHAHTRTQTYSYIHWLSSSITAWSP